MNFRLLYIPSFIIILTGLSVFFSHALDILSLQNEKLDIVSNEFERLSVRLAGMDTKMDKLFVANSMRVKNSINQKVAGGGQNSAVLVEDVSEDIINHKNLFGSYDPELPISPSNQPRMLVVNPTLKQSDDFELYKSLLDDPTYLVTLNITEFSQLPEVSNLPNIMRLSLISRAVQQYNKGLIDKDVFMGRTIE